VPPVLDLRSEAKRQRLVLPPLNLDDEARALAVAHWRRQMVNEHASARVFAALLPQLMKAGTPAREHRAVVQMMEQELRHGVLCAAMVEALGAEAVSEMPDLPDVPMHEDVEPVEALLRNVLSISCLHETFAVSAIENRRQRTECAPVAAILKEILRDEVKHARFGWKMLDSLSPKLDRGMRDRLSEYLVDAFRHLFEIQYVPASASAGVPEVGALPAAESAPLFIDVVRAAIVPGLEAHGLDATSALGAALGRDLRQADDA
jgi:hypothetical protein